MICILTFKLIRLFSRFDLWFSRAAFTTALLIIFIFAKRFNVVSSSQLVFNYSTKVLLNIVSSFIPSRLRQGSYLITCSVFFMFISINLISVNSFNFPLSSQISMVFWLGLTLWISFNIFSWFNNPKNNIAHLIPEGAPLAMVCLLLVIEAIRMAIRPITLRVRMIANILAGHLLMILLAGMVEHLGSAFPLYILLNTVELFVACIQSYIFIVMISLYYSDRNC